MFASDASALWIKILENIRYFKHQIFEIHYTHACKYMYVYTLE